MPMPSLTLAALISALISALALLPATTAKAAELRVIAGASLTSLMKDLGPPFEQASGHKLSIHFDSTPNIIARINSGTPFDLAIVPVDVFKDATAKAHFAAGPTVDIARVGYGGVVYGVAIKAGVEKPDISSAEALKKTLLGASSIAFVPSSAAGSYIIKV